MVSDVREAHFRKQFGGPFGDGGAPEITIDDHRHHHIFQSGEGGDQMMFLEYEPDGMPAQPRERGITKVHGILAIDEHVPGRRTVEQADDIEQRALARPRWTHQRQKFAMMQVEVDAVEDFDF